MDILENIRKMTERKQFDSEKYLLAITLLNGKINWLELYEDLITGQVTEGKINLDKTPQKKIT
jgi:hypothetical protein